MNRTIILIILIIMTELFCGFDCIAQHSGKIIFEERIPMEIPEVEGMDPAMFANLPTEMKILKELYYTPDASLHRSTPPKEKETEDYPTSDNQLIFNFEQLMPDEITYLDLKAKKAVRQRTIADRMYLVNSAIATPEWTLTGNQKTILNYSCQEALLTSLNDTIKIWFTKDIPVASGPGEFSGFPGMVLGYEISNHKLVCEAISIDPSFDSSIITPPAKGKKITEEKFHELTEEYMKELQEQYGEGGMKITISE